MLAVSAWLVAHSLSLLFPNVFIPWNAQSIDRLFQFRSDSETFRTEYDSTVIHVDLNNTSVERLGTYFPSRAVLGEVASAIGTMGSAGQIWDFIFPDPSEAGEAEKDLAFIRGSEDAGNVYFGCSFEFLMPDEERPERSIRADRREYLDRTSWNLTVEGDASTLIRGVNPEITFPPLSEAGRGIGHLNLRFDRDGVFRRAPLFFRFKDAYYPSMPFRAVCDYLRMTPDRIVVRPGVSVTLLGAQKPGQEPADIEIPINDHGEMTINFAGHWDRMKHISLSDVYEYAGSSDDLEFLAAWDLDNFLFINGHALFHRNLQGEPDLYFFYGPGIFIGARDRGRGRDDDLILGISGRFGLAYGFEPFEVYIQLTPRLDLIPGTDGDLGGGIGFRFFL